MPLDMRLLTKHKQLIERDANDISILWKLLQMLFYCVSAIAGYVTTHAFFILQDLFERRCILWATPRLEPDRMIWGAGTVNDRISSMGQPWQDRLTVSHNTQHHCSAIQIISILSCICGIVGFSFFSICGRGGYQVGIYYSPWRLVGPAVLFNLCLTLLTWQSACNFQDGFHHFQYRLNEMLNQSGYEPIMEYVQTGKENTFNRLVLKYYGITKISSWVEAAAWVMGLTILVLRVVNVTDFRLLKISVYAHETGDEEHRDESLRYRLEES
ncbi:uncharacterized protein LOC124414045 [Diprion similis]|uniref:uncharacterized protein LOC124414045 n=1 Tax=Diprion similis TaxID=362088 RepID=UPI001EF8C0C0|nr:uncharacterized protein LOC124414045 [Diprion similis]